jgi:hypothetical protein
MFEQSEIYRKYIIEFDLNNQKIYTVWGTDLRDKSEPDKLLVFRDKVLCFHDPKDIKRFVSTFFSSNYEIKLFDVSNLMKWLEKENFESPYAVYNIDLLNRFSSSLLLDKAKVTNLVDTLNIFYDLFEELENRNALKLLQSSEILELKEFVYDIYLWSSKTYPNQKTISFISSRFDNNYLRRSLNMLHNYFLNSIIYFDELPNKIAAG